MDEACRHHARLHQETTQVPGKLPPHYHATYLSSGSTPSTQPCKRQPFESTTSCDHFRVSRSLFPLPSATASCVHFSRLGIGVPDFSFNIPLPSKLLRSTFCRHKSFINSKTCWSNPHSHRPFCVCSACGVPSHQRRNLFAHSAPRRRNKKKSVGLRSLRAYYQVSHQPVHLHPHFVTSTHHTCTTKYVRCSRSRPRITSAMRHDSMRPELAPSQLANVHLAPSPQPPSVLHKPRIRRVRRCLCLLHRLALPRLSLCSSARHKPARHVQEDSAEVSCVRSTWTYASSACHLFFATPSCYWSHECTAAPSSPFSRLQYVTKWQSVTFGCISLSIHQRLPS